jgi:hypothetical protein
MKTGQTRHGKLPPTTIKKTTCSLKIALCTSRRRECVFFTHSSSLEDSMEVSPEQSSPGKWDLFSLDFFCISSGCAPTKPNWRE